LRFFYNDFLALEGLSIHFLYGCHGSLMLFKTDKGVVTLHLDACDFTYGFEFLLEVLWLALASNF